jgi:hypothetical protein
MSANTQFPYEPLTSAPEIPYREPAWLEYLVTKPFDTEFIVSISPRKLEVARGNETTDAIDIVFRMRGKQNG